MPDPVEGSTGGFTSRRELSNKKVTRLGEANFHRVDEDILSRIRSLYHSRNIHHPPRTPYPSDEQPLHGSEDSALKLIITRTVAKTTRREERLSLPEPQTASTVNHSPSMDIFNRPQSTIPKPIVSKPVLRSTSSTPDILADVDTATEVWRLVDGPSSLPGKKTFRLKLSLEDKVKSNESELKSCIEISPHIPENDYAIHEDELTCCPPCSPPESQPSKYTVNDNPWPKTIEAERSDLACFLAGCPPGQLNCQRHPRPRRAQSTSLMDHRPRSQDFRALAQDIPSDLDLIVAESRNRRGAASKTNEHLSAVQSISGTSATSADAFPHVMQSQKDTARKGSLPPFSASIFTNFSLPGPKPKKRGQTIAGWQQSQQAPDELAKDAAIIKPLEMKPLPSPKIIKKVPKEDQSHVAIRPKQSETSMKAEQQTPSIFSGASKASSKRHALLKPSVTEAEPADAGLPIPPVLSTIPSFGNSFAIDNEVEQNLEIQAKSADKIELDPYQELSSKIDRTLQEVGSSPVAEHLTNLQKTIDLVDDVQGRVRNVKQTLPKGNNQNNADGGMKKVPEINPVDAAYWGFVPAVKGTIEDAVQNAVRTAVKDIVVPPGAQKGEATDVYRALMAESLNEAAKSADDYLKRPSLWNESQVAGNPLQTTADNHKSKEEGIDTLQFPLQKPKNVFQPEQMLQTIPLDLAQLINPENQKQSKFANRTKDAPLNPTVIPDRNSSKDKVLGARIETPKVPRDAPKKPANDGTVLRPISSAQSLESLKSVVDLLDDQGSLSNMPPGRQLARKNTILWLRDLLSTKGPYEARLTARPVRTRRGQDTSAGRARSHTLPSRLMEDECANESTKWNGDPGQNVDRTILPETFARTIEDLEQLLNEALVIARQAAERDDPTYMPAVLGDAARILQASRKEFPEQYQPRRNNLRTMETCTYSDELSDIGSMHESLRSYSMSSGSEFSEEQRYAPQTYQDDHNRSIEIPLKSPRRRQGSAWPGKGRVSPPPFRAGSPRHSIDSEAADVPLMTKDHPGDKNLQYIKAADPRSIPAETEFEGARRKYTAPSEEGLNPPEALGELIGSGPPPEFYNPDPFKAPTSAGTARSITPPKSPRRKSPIRKSQTAPQALPQVIPTIITDDRGHIPLPRGASLSEECRGRGHSGDDHGAVKTKLVAKAVPGKREVREYIEAFRNPPIHPRGSSLALKKQAEQAQDDAEGYQLRPGQTYDWQDIDHNYVEPCSLNGSRNARTTNTYDRSVPCTSSMNDTDDSSGELDFDVGYTAASSGTRPQRTYQSTGQINDCRRQKVGGSYDSRGYPRDPNGYQDGNPRQVDENRGYSARDAHCNGGGPPQDGNGNRNGDRGGNIRGYPSKHPNDDGRYELRDEPDPNLPQTQAPRRRKHGNKADYNLGGKNHLSLRSNQHKGFSFAKSHKKPTIARDWKPARKRFVATVACFSTALVGILVGIYAGEIPSIQYYIVDLHHYTVLGNVFFYLGLAVPTFFCWPLPLLHGRKPYILGAMALAMPLLFPQAVAVGSIRSPYVRYWRIGLILPRGLMGFCLGFANMNFKSTLTDLFGASLHHDNPHQEVVDENDVRRHGGGLGIWLGLWTWSAMGSIGLGFMIGALIINHLPPAWGFYTSIFIVALVLLLNIITPEVRRSAFRRSVAEAKTGDGVSRRLGRGEVKMHMVQTGPKWWGEELHYGNMLSMNMLKQPGFLIMAVYVGWMYAQIVLIIVLLGSLMSNKYKFTSPLVGLSVMAVPLGAMVAIPFQSGSLFSQERNNGPTSDDDTLQKSPSRTSHTIRRAIFVLVLPFAGLGYTLSSTGPPIHFLVPILFAGLIGFLSNLAMAECHGILMETFDCSDLAPGMAGRARGSSGDKARGKRTNYSSFPRVASAFAITQCLGYIFSAISIGVGGSATRQLGQQAATGVMAGILLILSVLLLGVLIRFKNVQIIPDSKKGDLSRWRNVRKTSAFMRAQGAEAEEPWRPLIIGNPTHHTRRMNVLEMGSLTRFSEIRRKNLLVDANSLEANHPNMVVLQDVEERLKEKEQEFFHFRRRSPQEERMSRREERDPNDELTFTGQDPRDRREGMRSQAGNEGPRRRTTGRQ